MLAAGVLGYSRYNRGMNTKSLTAKQKSVLGYISDFMEEHGNAPTVREISDHFGYSSPKSATQILKALEDKSYISVTPRKSRGITLTTTTKQTRKAKDTIMKITDDMIDRSRINALIAAHNSDYAASRAMGSVLDSAMIDRRDAKLKLERLQSDREYFTRSNREIPTATRNAIEDAENAFEMANESFETQQRKRSEMSHAAGLKNELLRNIKDELKKRRMNVSTLGDY